MSGDNKPTKIFAKILLFGGIFSFFVFVLGSLVMFLWNATLPETVGVKPLTFWKAVGLLVLTRILFGSFHFGKNREGWSNSKKQDWRDKWMSMNEEEKENFKNKWKEKCGR